MLKTAVCKVTGPNHHYLLYHTTIYVVRSTCLYIPHCCLWSRTFRSVAVYTLFNKVRGCSRFVRAESCLLRQLLFDIHFNKLFNLICFAFLFFSQDEREKAAAADAARGSSFSSPSGGGGGIGPLGVPSRRGGGDGDDGDSLISKRMPYCMAMLVLLAIVYVLARFVRFGDGVM